MEITYKWTKERFLEASKANYDIKLSEPKFRLLGYAGLAAMLLGIYLAYTTGLYTTLNAATALTLYWYTLRWPLYRLQLASRFKKYASRNHTVSWAIDKETFTINTDTGRGHYNWSAVTDLVETTNDFLVRQYPVFYWLPKEYFQSGSDIAWFRDNIVTQINQRKSTP